MNIIDILRIATIAYILYKILTLKKSSLKPKKNKEPYYPKLLHKGDQYFTRAKDRQNYKVQDYKEKIPEDIKIKTIQKATKVKEIEFFRPDDADNEHYPLKRNFELHDLMNGKCPKNVDIKEVHRKLTEYKVEKLQVKNDGEHVNTNHNNVKSFTRDHIQYVNDSPLTTGNLEGVQFTAFDPLSHNIESVQDYYQNIENN